MKYSMITPETRPEVRTALLTHYDRAGRELPWRRDTDPYRVLVSEVMLQQTRVETVVGYYDPWLERFPSVEALADAEEDEVLKAWEGLGYYRRARNLHRAARVVREDHGGALPSTSSGLRALPGVGEYTAGAVASIAFGEATPAVDGNVRRVFARLFDVAEPRPAWLRDRATELLDGTRPGDWNQALMELGATVCVHRGPRCAECPVAQWCAARSAGTQTERPVPSKKRPVRTADIGLALLHRRGSALLLRRPDDGLLAGMWAFPEFALGVDAVPGVAADTDPDVAPGTAADAAVDAAAGVATTLGLTVIGGGVSLPDVRHRFTHLDARYTPIAMEVEGDVTQRYATDRCWVDRESEPDVALPVVQRSVLDSWRAVCALEGA